MIVLVSKEPDMKEERVLHACVCCLKSQVKDCVHSIKSDHF